MLLYIKRKYREESRLPMDLRNQLSETRIISFWDFRRSEYLNVEPDHQYADPTTKHKNMRIFNIPPLYKKYKMDLLNDIRPGALIAFVLSSKNYMTHERITLFPKYRTFFGHCIWKRKNTNHPTLLISYFLLGKFFFDTCQCFRS